VTPERWRRIKEISQAVWDRTPAERDSYLDSQTGGDADLRSEVEKILRYATGTGYLDKPAWGVLPNEREFEPGTLLGPYEILCEVGAGGMGRVYKARDTRLERTVAIKVLSAEFSHRLRIEGRAISALNHPHVCGLYDIGNQDGAAYLVMEYVQGETLAAALRRGPQPVGDVLRYGAEIAGALAAAHDQGIVHRDLKPANIMITPSGAKVLDFGVARMAHEEPGESGGVAGTAAYMSPSQLNGSPADRRSDIFALGLVLCEMVTGTRPSAESAEERKNLPSELSALIERCLQVEAWRRFQRMDEVQTELERLQRKLAAQAARRSVSRPWRVAVAAVFIAAAGGRAVWWSIAARPSAEHRQPPVVEATSPATEPRAPEPRVVESSAAAPAKPAVPPVTAAPPVVRVDRRVNLDPPSVATLAKYTGIERDPSLSPDGTKVAFAWQRESRQGFGIYLRPVTGAEAPIQLTSGEFEDWGPAWSPDGKRIAFRRKGGKTGSSGIYWVSASGGTENYLVPIGPQDSSTLPQLSWSHDGKWVAAPDREPSGTTHIYLISVATGEKRALTSNAVGTDHAPAFSPDGKSLAYNSCSRGLMACDVFVLDLGRDMRSVRRSRITDERDYVRGIAWAPDGKSLIYSAAVAEQSSTFLWRVSVDPPGIPQRIDMAGPRAAHPAISGNASLLAYTRIGNWNLMMIRNFR
jgi:serine/threonine protein kinase